MNWQPADTSPSFGKLYECGRYRVRHYTESQPLGFGIVCARAYFDAEQIGEWTGSGALSEAMSAAERHSRFVPELEFANVQEVTR